ncbi:MAG: hypothetical protein FJ088_02305 [Deltaproteobacteria bacterium]|nr:hypothetical protein [Deltaproteobacteria bacterium]
MEDRKMISVWEWVGMILSVYGAIITAMGIKNLVTVLPSTVLGNLNPPLWWGGIMLLSGSIFLFAGRRSRK